MNWTKLQRRAGNRMKESTYLLSDGQIGMARFVSIYYANFVLGMGVSVLGTRWGVR